MAKTYYDNREKRIKTVPNCARHGLVWNPKSQRCEKITGLGYMAEDFYTDDYYGGDFYDGGYGYSGDVSYLANGGGDYYGSGGDDFYYGYGFDSYAPIDYAPEFDLPTFSDDPFFFGLPFAPLPDVGFIEPLPPIDLFAETIQMETEPGYMALPDLQTYYPLPYVTPWQPFDTPLPYIEYPEGPYFPLPSPPETSLPCAGRTANGLPPPCPAGYGRGPFGSDPCLCYPLPAAPTQTQQPKPPSQQTSAPKPPTQQQQQQAQVCPTGYCKHPTTGQCMPIPQGYARHPQTQVCTLATQQAAPSETEDAFADLKKLPWWVWAAGVGLVLLSGRGR